MLPAGRLAAQVPNDDCQTAVLVPVSATQQAVIVGDSTLALPDPGLPACDMAPPRDSGDAGVWYRLIGTGNRIQIDTCSGASLDLVLRVFCGSCEAPVCIGADDDGCDGGVNLNPRLAFCSTAGAEYFLLVSRYGTGLGGAFTLTFTDTGSPCPSGPCGVPPANDTCAGAIPITIGAAVVGSTALATPDLVGTCAGGTVRSGVWYSFTGSGRLTQATTCDSATGSNTSLLVFTGQCGSLTCVAGGSSSPACADRADAASTINFCTLPGTMYFVLVSDEVDGSGLFRLSLVDHGFSNCTPAGACCVGTACSIAAASTCTGVYLGDGTVCGASTWPNLAIPDNAPAGLASSLIIPAASGPITDLNVSLLIAHTWQGDLRVTLQHNDGEEVVLIDRPGFPQTAFGFSADNYGTAGGAAFILDDQAIPARTYDVPAVPVPGTNNPSGSWQPDTGPLSAFNGQNLAGTWTLRVRDLASQDTGTLRAWALIPTPGPAAPCTAPNPDCFRPLVAGQPPQNAGHFTGGGPDGIADQGQCVGDWDRSGQLVPADVAQYITTWYYSVENPGNLDADIDCDGQVVPADVASFISHWVAGVSSPGSEGC